MELQNWKELELEAVFLADTASNQYVLCYAWGKSFILSNRNKCQNTGFGQEVIGCIVLV